MADTTPENPDHVLDGDCFCLECLQVEKDRRFDIDVSPYISMIPPEVTDPHIRSALTHLIRMTYQGGKITGAAEATAHNLPVFKNIWMKKK